MSFGGQTVTFVAIAEDLNDRDRYNKPARVRTEVSVAGCRFRPMSAKEKTELGTNVTDPWKLTAPPVAVALNAKSDGEIKYQGSTFTIIGGPRSFTDFSDRVFKVTVICERTGPVNG